MNKLRPKIIIEDAIPVLIFVVMLIVVVKGTFFPF